MTSPKDSMIRGMIPPIGKLTMVDLREIWKNEEYDFTTWLANEENLAQLSDEIGIEITLTERGKRW